MFGSIKINNGRPNKKKVWNAGLYVRLSKEDLDRNRTSESVSIESQKITLNQYVAYHSDILVKDFYVDEDFSGGNFNRPGFIKLKKDIDAKLINCLIVKDLSRFGRDLVDVKRYLQDEFVLNNVRVIVVNDNIDSYLDPDSVDSNETNFKILMNNNYLIDNSLKVRTVLNSKKKNGEFIGAFPPYGYLKDPDNKNKLVIDEEVEDNIREIYQMYINGMSQSAIAKEFNKRNVLSPASYIKSKHQNYYINTGAKNKQSLMWTASSIKNILTKEVYVGDMVQSKRKKLNPKKSKVIQNDKEDWIIVKNTHEPIIAREDYELVQQLMLERKRDGFIHDGKPHSLFTSFVVCGDCGYNMVRKKTSEKNNKYTWMCSRYFKNKEMCSQHFTREDDIYNAVFVAIKNFIGLTIDFSKLRVEKKKEVKAVVKPIDYDMEIESYNQKNLCLYKKYRDGGLSKDEFITKRSVNDKKIEGFRLQKELRENEDETKQRIKEEIIPEVIKYKNIRKLTRDLVEEFVESISVYTDNRIEIKLKCKDEFEFLKTN